MDKHTDVYICAGVRVGGVMTMSVYNFTPESEYFFSHKQKSDFCSAMYVKLSTENHLFFLHLSCIFFKTKISDRLTYIPLKGLRLKFLRVVQ